MSWMNQKCICLRYRARRSALRADAAISNERRATDVAGQAGRRSAGLCGFDETMGNTHAKPLPANGRRPASGRGSDAKRVCAALLSTGGLGATKQIFHLSLANCFESVP